MEKNNSIKLFEDKNIRVAWNEDEENWYFSVVDVVGILTDNDYQKSRNYWKWLKNKLNQEGSELVSNTNQLKMKAYDGKLRDTDVMNNEFQNMNWEEVDEKVAENFIKSMSFIFDITKKSDSISYAVFYSMQYTFWQIRIE